jgi:N-acetylmuramoyl-L-alanine amidase
MKKWREAALRGCLLILLLSSQTLLAEQSKLQGVRLWTAPDNTRVVFDINEPVEYKLFTLNNPDRVVIDVQQANWQGGARPDISASGFVKGLRSAPQPDRSIRLVLDTDRPINPKSFLLRPNQRYGHRLVVDLYAKNDGPKQAIKTVNTGRSDGFRDVIVAIDAGHGGEDPGARGKKGTWEKDVTLQVARKLAKLIDQQPGMKAVLVRSGDYYLRLRTRIEKARQERADIFLSIHADAFRDPKVRGSSVYILSDRGATSEAARWLASKENSADELMGGVSLDDKDDMLKSVLLDLSQTATIEASAHLAQSTLKHLKRVGKVHRRHVERAGFAVLKSPDIPSILVELAFISNPTEEKNLTSRAHQDKMAKAILSGLKDYLRRRPPDNTLFAARTHTIQRGDTLSELSQRYRVSTSSLKDFNGLRSDGLKIGQVLRIPGHGS